MLVVRSMEGALYGTDMYLLAPYGWACELGHIYIFDLRFGCMAIVDRVPATESRSAISM